MVQTHPPDEGHRRIAAVAPEAVEKTACAHVEGFGKKLDGDRPLPVGFDIFFGQPDLPRFDRFGRLPQQMTEIVPPGLQQ